MTPKQKLEVEQSTHRQKINELLGKGDQLTDDERTELGTLTTRMQELELELRAAIVADGADPEKPEVTEEPTEDTKAREFRELRSSIRLGNYVGAAMEMRSVDGKEAEFNQEVGLRQPGEIPLELLAPVERRSAGDGIETRATTNVDTTRRQQRWLDRLFSETAAAHLGITFETVESGVASFPVTTAGAAAAQRGRAQAADDAAWTVGTSELKPTRNAVRAVFTAEDALRLPALEEALRRDLGMALTEGVDRSIFVGDGGANEDSADIAGLNTLADIGEHEITQANKVTANGSLAAFLAMIDGKHAGMVEDLRVVLAVGAHNLWAGTIANAAAENQTVLGFLKANGLSARVRGDIETATTAGKFGAFVGRGRGIEGAGVAAVWESATLIRDPYTGAGKGEVALTLSHFWAFGVPRKSNFQRVKFVA